jgi:hypothetical protein
MKPGSPHFEAVQSLALRGWLGPDAWLARADAKPTEAEARDWLDRAGATGLGLDQALALTRGELLARLRETAR